ncbi:uncharacterized protein LOC118101986 [Hippoglossus stenolepis]|uniref:uncharacterized protein LOC118101986 n=1 Tax=Hippoglossus stenolepis TaxID=195615 RepID=UPI001FAEDF5F|nr:uncharacterized protein LOC118101986 [Hippoglossus stenolepis]
MWGHLCQPQPGYKYRSDFRGSFGPSSAPHRSRSEQVVTPALEVSKDAAKAVMLVSHFEASINAPAMAPLRCAEDVTRRLAETLPWDGQSRESWVRDLERLKEELQSAVHFILQPLRAVSSYHHYFNKANSWYSLVLCENILQELLSGVVPTEQHRRVTWGKIPVWRCKLSTFLKKNPPPDTEELVHLSRLSNVVPGDAVQQAGRQMSERCMTLRNLLTSSGPVNVGHLQLALQWQYELLRSSHLNQFHAHSATNGTTKEFQNSLLESKLTKCERGKGTEQLLGTSPLAEVSEMVSAACKSPSLKSFDSGCDGDGSSRLEAWKGREEVKGLPRLAGIRDCVRPTISHPQILREHSNSVSDPVDHRGEADSSGTRIQIVTKVTEDSLNLKIKMKLSAAHPSNVWLSLPAEDLENSYTVIITHSPTTQKTDTCTNGTHCNSSPVQPTKMEESGPRSRDWIRHSQSSLDDPGLSPIRNVLSSTITDGRDESTSTTEGIPSLLWDSYDLHDHSQDAVDGHDHWPLWSEDQFGVTSFSGLTEADVLGLGDDLDPAEYDNLKEAGSTGSASETWVSEYGHCNEASTESAAFHSWPDLLTELRLVYILDKGIMEEHLKTYDTQCSEETHNKELCERPSDKWSSVSKEKEFFWLQLEKEKKEVTLEKKLDKVGADLVPGAVPEATGSCFEDDPSGCNRTTLNSISDLKQPAKKPKNKLLGCVYWKDLDTSGEYATICKPEASLIPETWPDDGVFDPGGKSLHPPMPRKASLPMNTNLTELESPCSTELATPALSSVAQDPDFVQLDLQDKSIKSQLENVTPAISFHLEDVSEITTRSDEGAPNMEIRTSSLSDECPVEQSAPQLLPDQSLELDPGGRDNLTENLPDGVLAPFNIDMREILDSSFGRGILCCPACTGLTRQGVFVSPVGERCWPTCPPPEGRKKLQNRACKSFSRNDPKTDSCKVCQTDSCVTYHLHLFPQMQFRHGSNSVDCLSHYITLFNPESVCGVSFSFVIS